MLDKTKTYAGYSGSTRKFGQPPSGNFQKVKILFEDETGYYVESLTKKDAEGNGTRYSVKKHCFVLIDVDNRNTVNVGDKFMLINGGGGGPFTVTVLANEHSSNPEATPVTVVYQGMDGRVWAETFDDFVGEKVKI